MDRIHEGHHAFCEDDLHPMGVLRPVLLRAEWMQPGHRHKPYVPDWIDLRIDLFCTKAPFTGATRGSGNPRSGPDRGFSVALHGWRGLTFNTVSVLAVKLLKVQIATPPVATTVFGRSSGLAQRSSWFDLLRWPSHIAPEPVAQGYAPSKHRHGRPGNSASVLILQ